MVAGNSLGRRWILFLQKKVEHVKSDCRKHSILPILFNPIAPAGWGSRFPVGIAQPSAGRAGAGGSNEIRRTSGGVKNAHRWAEIRRRQPSTLGHEHKYVRWMHMRMYRRSNPKAAGFQNFLRIWYENVLIRTHVRPQAGWGREGSNEIRRASGCVKNAHRIKGGEFPK